MWRGTRADGTPTPAAWYFITIAGAVADALAAVPPDLGPLGVGKRLGGEHVVVRLVALHDALLPERRIERCVHGGGPVPAAPTRATTWCAEAASAARWVEITDGLPQRAGRAP